MTARYAAAADEALAEAERLRTTWSAAGDDEGARLVERLERMLSESRDAARRGLLPPRDGGFPLTRFVGEYEWGAEGSGLVDRVYAMQHVWEGRA